MAQPVLFIVAGPNGAGKSTLTKSGRFERARIFDPDAVARRMAPDDPARAAVLAGRRIAQERRAAMAAGETILLETTLSGRDVLRLMREARATGYRVELHYIRLESVAVHLLRIECRVRAGGHDVPKADVRRRFSRSMENLPRAMALADETRFYTNDDPDTPLDEAAIAVFPSGPPPRWVAEACMAALLPLEAEGG
ncbi:MAG: zeta toxin family protein [Alphaproteobacteria bacterium]|nr:zeta toxin family protein [Alphaproteobacteria bacterium]